LDLNGFLDQIKSSDADVRYKAWRTAGPMGATAVAPLGDLAALPDKGVAKAAKAALQEIAHYAARPGAGAEARVISVELVRVAASIRPRLVRADALYLLSFTADSRAVPDIARLLKDADVREAARMTLERIPGSASLHALRQEAKDAHTDFRSNLEQSLYNRNLTRQTVGVAPAR
jgi:HEAT repeat protein